MDDKKLLLNKIVQHLILCASFTDNLGLLTGKMGICIFFFRYARYTQSKHYADFAGELLDEIYDEINSETPIDFKRGLSGICWGIEYIIHNGFVNTCANEILADIDTLILERDVRKMTDFSLETGLEGLVHYVLARCSNKQSIPIDCQYIYELKFNMENRMAYSELVIELNSLLKREKIEYKFDLFDMIAARNTYKKKFLFKEANLGISRNGLTGFALRLLNESGK